MKGRIVYELVCDVRYESSQTVAIYSNEDSALRALAERFNECFNQYIGTGDLPEWGGFGDNFSRFDVTYEVIATEVLD